MRALTLFAAGLLCGLAIQTVVAENEVVGLNHVGISVPNMPEAVTYYTQKIR